VKGAAFPLALVIVAEIAFRGLGVKSDTLAAPSAIVVAAWSALLDGSLAAATAQTLWAALAGLVLGGSVGLVLSILFGLFAPLARLLQIPIEVLRPIPSIAVLPIAMLVFGFGFRMEIAIVAFACLWPVLIIGQAAIAGIEPRLLEVGRALGLGLGARIVKIVLPAALPRLFVAFRLAASAALIVAVTVEIAANPLGLGYQLIAAQQSLQPATMLATLLWVGVVGWGLNWLLLTAQRRLFGPALAGALAKDAGQPAGLGA
jgi:NitT/TauT family transport system permease protein